MLSRMLCNLGMRYMLCSFPVNQLLCKEKVYVTTFLN